MESPKRNRRKTVILTRPPRWYTAAVRKIRTPLMAKTVRDRLKAAHLHRSVEWLNDLVERAGVRASTDENGETLLVASLKMNWCRGTEYLVAAGACVGVTDQEAERIWDALLNASYPPTELVALTDRLLEAGVGLASSRALLVAVTYCPPVALRFLDAGAKAGVTDSSGNGGFHAWVEGVSWERNPDRLIPDRDWVALLHRLDDGAVDPDAANELGWRPRELLSLNASENARSARALALWDAWVMERALRTAAPETNPAARSRRVRL